MEKTSEEDCKEEEDSEGDEVVDIERIEDKEEDTALVSLQLQEWWLTDSLAGATN